MQSPRNERPTCTSVAYPEIFFRKEWGFNKFSWRQRAERTGIWGRKAPSQGYRLICKWVTHVFLLGCHGSIFRGTGNSVQLYQNYGISLGGGGWLKPQTPHGRPLLHVKQRQWQIFEAVTAVNVKYTSFEMWNPVALQHLLNFPDRPVQGGTDLSLK
jgi:hypothetical protein